MEHRAIDAGQQPIKPPMRAMCAWHVEFFGTERVMREAAPGHEADPETHGVCPDCREKELNLLALLKSQGER